MHGEGVLNRGAKDSCGQRLLDISCNVEVYMCQRQPGTLPWRGRLASNMLKLLALGHLYLLKRMSSNLGDGKLSHHEFIELMKNRQKRGFRTPSADKPGWEGFKACVKKEIAN
ncbi:hypothetical protein AC249_AIPGENE23357 [Exaiptasia diaphana]|nr:hypothetical protein AC249_AIPGENE23357 [Exaiptasia diaphana]